jgi:hypothetical protein
MRVVLCRKPGYNGAKLADDIYGEIDPQVNVAGWFDPRAIQINADPECSDTPDGDILLFDSVNETLSVWLNRREVFAQLDGEYRMGFVQS